MKIITPPLNISDTPFEEDLFKRRYFGDALTTLVKSTSDPLVIGIDAKWGEGKTTFVKKWQALLDEQNIHNIYIDAFKNDHVDDAFMVVASAITDYTEEHAASKTPALVDKVKKVGVSLLSWSAKVAVKAATLNAIKDADLDSLQEIGKDFSEDFSKYAGELIAEKLKVHKQELESIENFKDFLSKLPEEFDSDNPTPLVIIIDELDRCRPSFAIEVLEKIKHLFSVPNVVFVLVINKQQLEESIRTTYGSNIDAHTYLQKFINIDTNLPKRTGRYSDTQSYYEFLLGAHQIPMDQDLFQTFTSLGERLDLSLRQVERSVSNLALGLTMNKTLFQHQSLFLAFAAVMKACQPKLLKDLYNEKINFRQLCSAMGLPDPQSQNGDLTLMAVLRDLHNGLMTQAEYKEQSELSQSTPGAAQGYEGYQLRYFKEIVASLLMFSIR